MDLTSSSSSSSDSDDEVPISGPKPEGTRLIYSSFFNQSSLSYQRYNWRKLKSSIKKLIKMMNGNNDKVIWKRLLLLNIERGRGLLCQSILSYKENNHKITRSFATLISRINDGFPNIGELFLTRCIIEFNTTFNKDVYKPCSLVTILIAHLVNYNVAHEMLALDILKLCSITPTLNSMKLAFLILKICGVKVNMTFEKETHFVLQSFYSIARNDKLNENVQQIADIVFTLYKTEIFHNKLQIYSEKFNSLIQSTHLITLKSATDSQAYLDVCQYDLDYLANEQFYKMKSADILKINKNFEIKCYLYDSDADEESNGEENETEPILDKGVSNLLDRLILTKLLLKKSINSILDSPLNYFRKTQKLMNIKPGQELEFCFTYVNCCCEQRTYTEIFGFIAQMCCELNILIAEPFEKVFIESYGIVHTFNTNKLQGVAKFFGYLLSTNSISWNVFKSIHLNKDEITSEKISFLKTLFQELVDQMGYYQLSLNIVNPLLQNAFKGIFIGPDKNVSDVAIELFTSMGLEGLIDDYRFSFVIETNLSFMDETINVSMTEITAIK